MREVTIINADVIDGLRSMPDGSAQTCVTSPPYWGLRDYGVSGQVGLEETPEEYVAKMVEVFREVRRVLADDGTAWVNLGDRIGSDRSLACVPWMTAIALKSDGWTLRSDVVWSKPNPIPEPVTDRPMRSHEYLFLLAKSARYFYDADEIREPHVGSSLSHRGGGRYAGKRENQDGAGMVASGNHGAWDRPRFIDPRGVNARSVWSISSEPYSGAHFATFPQELAARCIKAGSREGNTVLDPFMGAATTALAAVRLGRDAIGCEINPEYAELGRSRLVNECGLLARVQTKTMEAEQWQT